MKKALVIFSALFLLLTIMPNESFAQLKTRKELNKERKDLRDRVEDKSLKKARQEAERLEKEGFMVEVSA